MVLNHFLLTKSFKKLFGLYFSLLILRVGKCACIPTIISWKNLLRKNFSEKIYCNQKFIETKIFFYLYLFFIFNGHILSINLLEYIVDHEGGSIGSFLRRDIFSSLTASTRCLSILRFPPWHTRPPVVYEREVARVTRHPPQHHACFSMVHRRI